VRHDDRAARLWLAGGQVALVGGAVLFILELKRDREPRNIPFAPYLAAGRYGMLVGMQLR
jgi:prepilin signal peptidase PulO-like enzyme (type II secretory pathway)